MLPTKFQVKWPYCSEEEVKNRFFLDGGILGYPMEKILAIFDLQLTLMLPTKFQVNWPLGSGEEAKRFSRWPLRGPS